MNPFTFHTGFEFNDCTKTKPQFQGDCVFCGKEEHFFYDPTDYMWDCKHCHKHGNLYTFLNLFHTEICTNGPVAQLAAERDIPVTFFRLNEIRFNPTLSTSSKNIYVIPTYNKEGHLNNLYKVCEVWSDKSSSFKKRILCTPSLEATLFNYPQKIATEVWLVEGHWDKLAAEAVVGASRQITCIGYPGSGFKQSWCNAFGGKDLCIFPDNDEAGERELNNILKRLQNAPHKPKSIRIIKWPTESLTPGFDLNDLWRKEQIIRLDSRTSIIIFST
jgi:hypothetical protein